MNKKEIQILLKELEDLPPEFQDAFLFMVENINVVRELCKGPKMSEEKIETFSDIALKKKDYFTFCLLQYKKAKDRYENSK